MQPLRDRVAVVAGATRGAGRGIARALGEAGATVYCTGRSLRGRPATEGRPETLEETAEMVTATGGRGIWVRVDHTVEEQVEALFARVRNEQGRLDVLVNDVWGGDALTEWGVPFWELSFDKGRLMLERAVLSHVVTSRWGVPLMVERGRGLVVEVTDGAAMYYRGNLFYDLAKTTAIRLAHDMAIELQKHGVVAVAVTPGFLRSEFMLERFGVTEANWRDAIAQDPHYAESETPLFVGRAIAALAADPQVARKNGQALSSWRLAREYGFDDEDGRRPDFGGYLCGLISARLAADVLRSEAMRRRDRDGVRVAVGGVFEAMRLQFLLDLQLGESWLDDLLALGPDATTADVARYVERRFGIG